ncbi:MAG: hypothetical protein JW814_11800 [Candidatus Krumholzibacteriota bacterium]|nr:hypothetical protein [Candidatus Krumholzibacteriota bacterium]
MKHAILALSISLCVSVQLGCGEDNTIFDLPSCDCNVTDTVTVDLGATFTITLFAAYSVGEWWEFEKGFDDQYVELESYKLIPVTPVDPNDDICGIAYYQNWKYRTRKQGVVCATLIYRCINEDRSQDEKNVLVIIE